MTNKHAHDKRSEMSTKPMIEPKRIETSLQNTDEAAKVLNEENSLLTLNLTKYSVANT